jgi:hypothetical protein
VSSELHVPTALPLCIAVFTDTRADLDVVAKEIISASVGNGIANYFRLTEQQQK